LILEVMSILVGLFGGMELNKVTSVKFGFITNTNPPRPASQSTPQEGNYSWSETTINNLESKVSAELPRQPAVATPSGKGNYPKNLFLKLSGSNNKYFFQNNNSYFLKLSLRIMSVLTLVLVTLGIIWNKIGLNLNSYSCHRVDFGVDSCRLAFPFTSANHLAGFLLLIIAFGIYEFMVSKDNKTKLWNAFLVLSSYVFLFLTYSRSALIGGFLILVVLGLFSVVKSQKVFRILSVLSVLVTVLLSIIIGSVDPAIYSFLPKEISKPSSSIEHYRLTQVNLEILQTKPSILLTGLGIGQSGPAANYFDLGLNTLKEQFGKLTYKWYINEDRVVIPENWYLQLILNGGLIYAMLWVFLVTIGLKSLWQNLNSKNPVLFLQIGLITILIMNLFLHIFESQSVFWIYAILTLIIQDSQKLLDQNSKTIYNR
jgi:O-Antigen ligase